MGDLRGSWAFPLLYFSRAQVHEQCHQAWVESLSNVEEALSPPGRETALSHRPRQQSVPSRTGDSYFWAMRWPWLAGLNPRPCTKWGRGVVRSQEAFVSLFSAAGEGFGCCSEQCSDKWELSVNVLPLLRSPVLVRALGEALREELPSCRRWHSWQRKRSRRPQPPRSQVPRALQR